MRLAGLRASSVTSCIKDDTSSEMRLPRTFDSSFPLKLFSAVLETLNFPLIDCVSDPWRRRQQQQHQCVPENVRLQH